MCDPTEPELDRLMGEFIMHVDPPVDGLEEGNILGEGQHSYMVTWISEDGMKLHVFWMDDTDRFIYRESKKIESGNSIV